ncbi:carbohydrate ABC transporter permease [Microbacterium sp. NPDC058342]|uniref:carbohydrate ABC transporter permease n=1 Tax=Microbacterium sp. NPDC058342 TaxID=3346454 RepID=UPI00365170DE
MLIALYLLPALLVVGIFTYYPILNGLQMAFRNWNLANFNNTDWVGLDNFIDVLKAPSFGVSLLNSVVWVLGSLIPQFVIGFALALWLRRKFRFRGLYQALAFVPWAISGFLIGILFRWMFNAESGVINDLLLKANLIEERIPWLADPSTAMTAAIIANVWYGATFFAVMMLAALQSVPEELYEAAALDGAGKGRTLFSVTIPYIRGTILLTVLLRTIWIFNSPEIIYGMTGGGPAGKTSILTSYMIQVNQQGNYGQASAIGLIVMLILAIFAAFYLAATREKESSS